MSALAPDALAGIAVGWAPGEAAGAGEAPTEGREVESTAAALGRRLVALGARPAAAEERVDLLLVALGGTDRGAGGAPAPPAATAALDRVAVGALAAALTAAFAAARDGAARLNPGGCLLFVLAGPPAPHPEDDPTRAALASLTRTLALEWAPARRVNALVCPAPEAAPEATALLAWPASRTLTGAVLDLTA
ncbi:MAG: hypothetical protein QM729_19715 [Solirubrobacterales bacterium]